MSGPSRPRTPGAGDRRRVAARATSFGEDAAGYDEARPSYPAALVDDLVGTAPGRILDVGCGTGKAALLLQRVGARVLGIEADERMAAVARRHGVEVEIARFEEWEPAGRSFSLLTAAQSWHWVDPDRGPEKAAQVLEPGGRIALFWNLRTRPPAEIADAFDACYRRHAPELAGAVMAPGAHSGSDSRGLEGHLDLLDKSGHFEAGEARRYRWRCHYDAPSWRALLATQSDHRMLEAGPRARLLDAAAAIVEDLGGLEVAYVTLALFARRRP